LTLKDASRVLTPEHLAGDANAGSHPLLVAIDLRERKVRDTDCRLGNYHPRKELELEIDWW